MTSISVVNESDTVVSDFSKVISKSFNPHEDKQLRVPFYLTSSYRRRLGIDGVSMMVNPTSIGFSQEKRITKKYTQAGAVYYHWANKMGRNNDILELSFAGQTGNMNIRLGTAMKGMYGDFQGQLGTQSGPLEWLNNLSDKATKVGDTNLAVALQGGDYAASGAAKMASFWNLYSLTREPVVDPRTGQPVYYYISYSSPLMGNTYVTFIGHFSSVLSFSEEATTPFNAQYNFAFTVLASTPSMDYLYPTMVNNLRTVFTNPL